MYSIIQKIYEKNNKILGIDKGERIDKKVKSELIQKASDQSYNKSGKLVVPEMDINVGRCSILYRLYVLAN